MIRVMTRLDYPQRGEIKVRYEIDIEHPFTVYLEPGGISGPDVVSLKYEEAKALQEQITAAIQDYERSIKCKE